MQNSETPNLIMLAIILKPGGLRARTLTNWGLYWLPNPDALIWSSESVKNITAIHNIREELRRRRENSLFDGNMSSTNLVTAYGSAIFAACLPTGKIRYLR